MAYLWIQFELLSDAAQLAIVGGGFWLFAGFCALMERRRSKKRDVSRLERVGFMPWTTLFVLCAIIGGGCLAMSLPVVLGSLV
ncbi:hypothetical protein [Erythrobacter insulae]|uniref:hypothetical protein n=1 Tax=Erythrobacter insulae TaxID=2584124 RepID=UPI001F2AFA3D|nr:hypothetical protein [Erythrobacter insulae]